MSRTKEMFTALREVEAEESLYLDDSYHYEVFKSKFNKKDYEDSTEVK
tara:strand:+ start:3054 stop:3197 length:144 start_codon:yes stop_codon:yes gene_type:complete